MVEKPNVGDNVPLENDRLVRSALFDFVAQATSVHHGVVLTLVRLPGPGTLPHQLFVASTIG